MDINNLSDKDSDLMVMSFYRNLMTILIVAAIVMVVIGYTKDITFLLFGGTIPLSVAVYCYRVYAVKRDEIAYKFKTDASYREGKNTKKQEEE